MIVIDDLFMDVSHSQIYKCIYTITFHIHVQSLKLTLPQGALKHMCSGSNTQSVHNCCFMICFSSLHKVMLIQLNCIYQCFANEKIKLLCIGIPNVCCVCRILIFSFALSALLHKHECHMTIQ